jgi:cephalosporin hydroxylase
MLFFTPRLRRAVERLRIETRARVAKAQGGVPTFFDNFLEQTLSEIVGSQSSHRWDPALETSDDTAALHVNRLRWLDGFVSRRAAGRFVSFSERIRNPDISGDIPAPVLCMSQGVPTCMSWKGLPLFKTAYDFAITPMLLEELKPKSIFEIGAGLGASALWMADLLRTQGNPAMIHSVDLRKPTLSDPQIRFYQGDCRIPQSLFPAEVLEAAPHPWLVIEDAHVNLPGTLALFDRFLLRGDYLIVEDSLSKRSPLSAFMATRAKSYQVDAFYTDFFGHNATSAPDTIFRRG